MTDNKKIKVLRSMLELDCELYKKKKVLCTSHNELFEYAIEKIEKCPHEENIICQVCAIHCYSNERREEIIEVMRSTRVRMMIYHPIITMQHLILLFKERKRQKVD